MFYLQVIHRGRNHQGVTLISIHFSPEKFSTPGNCYALRFAIGRNESDQSLLDSIRVFVHPPGEFSFFVEQDFMPNVLRIDLLDLKY